MGARVAIFGLQGLELTSDERAFFRESDPWGFILFARNVDTVKQIGRLTNTLRDCVGRDAPILIDQEGGDVARLKPPTWRKAPPARLFGDLYLCDPDAGIEATKINHRLLAQELRSVGVDVDCAPVLDLRVSGADVTIGDRAFGNTPEMIAKLGGAAMEGLTAGGVAPIIKHIPGHGRAEVDSHFELPRVDHEHEQLSRTDFAPFKALASAPMAMTAHIVYADIDPDNPATTSSDMIDKVIRSEIGFSGLLMTDDLSMQALSGSLRERAEQSLAAGCDVVLHCNSDSKEMQQIAESTPELAGRARERAENADKARSRIDEFDAKQAQSRLDYLLERVIV
ncbi:MAG: beta-N-acetylhexosaminidase [Halioglobus sp.]